MVRALRRRTIVNLVTDVNHEVDDYVYFSHLMWARGHVTNLLLVADESELSLPNVGWLTLMESEELRKITIDTSEFKTEYDKEVHSVLTGIMSSCKIFGTRIFLFRNTGEVDFRITEIADSYRLARENAYR